MIDHIFVEAGVSFCLQDVFYYYFLFRFRSFIVNGIGHIGEAGVDITYPLVGM